MAWVGSAGVDSALYSRTSPAASASTKSVNVPPASMPSRYWVAWCCPSVSRPARCLRSLPADSTSTSSAGQVGEDDAIVVAGAFDRDQAVLHVPDDLLDRPLRTGCRSRRRRGSCW